MMTRSQGFFVFTKESKWFSCEARWMKRIYGSFAI